MKTINKLFIAALATTAITACNNEFSNGSLENNGIVNFTMGIGETASSRISMEDGSYTATFSANNAVGIFVEGQDSYKNLEYKTEDGKVWKGPQINLPEGGTYTYYAYYPYSSEVNAANAIAISVAADQEAGGYLANDYLYCKTTSGETKVTLDYEHALSLVDVTLAGAAIGDDAVVSIINVATDATLDVTAPSVTTGTTLANVKMDVLTNTKNFRAIIPAQKIAASTPVFRIETKGRTYEAKYNGEIDFAKGKYLALTITIGEEGGTPEIEITTSASINDWTEGSIAGGDITVEEVPIILPLGESLKDVIEKPASLTEDTWFGLKRKADEPGDISYSIETDETLTWKKAAKLSYTSTWDASANEGKGKAVNNSWYIATLGYYHCSTDTPINGGIYKVTIKIKGESDDTGNISKISFCCRNKDNTAAFSIASSISAINDHAIKNNGSTIITKGATTANTWEEFIFYINFDKKTDINTTPSGSSKLADTTKDDLSAFDLRLYTNNPATADVQANTATIYISDITMEPYVAE